MDRRIVGRRVFLGRQLTFDQVGWTFLCIALYWDSLSEIHSASFRFTQATSDFLRFVQIRLNFTQSPSGSPNPIQAHTIFSRSAQFHSGPLGLAWIHTDRCCLSKNLSDSLSLTQIHSGSLGLCKNSSDSRICIRIHLELL